MPYDYIDRSTVEQMVRAFYTKVLHDKMLQPTFARTLGLNMKGEKWYEHFNTLDRFWYTMMTGEEGYKGHPFPPHAFLGTLTRKMFERWLHLFYETVHEFYTPEIAAAFYDKANTFAEEFMENLSVDDEDDD